MTNEDDFSDETSPMDVAAQQQPPEEQPKRGRGRPRRGAANGTAGTAVEEPPTQQGQPTITVKVSPPPRPPEAQAPQEPEGPREISTLELLAGSQGGVEVSRVGPGIGPGWKGGKYRGVEVQMGRAGTLQNSPKLLDEAQSNWGGGRYKFLGSVGGRPVEFEKVLPGAPKALIYEDEDDSDDDDLPPGAYDPTTLFAPGLTPGAFGGPDPNWLWSVAQNRYVYAGRGQPMSPPPQFPPGQQPGGAGGIDPRLLMHASKEDEEEKRALKAQLDEMRRKAEIEPLRDQITQLKDLIRQQALAPQVPQKDPFEAIAKMMEAQAKQAEIDRKARADEERMRLDRERAEAKDRQERLDRERKEAQDKYDREARETREREERILKEARDREDRRLAEEARRRDEDRKDAAAARAEEARRQEAMLKAMTEKGGIGKQITEMVAAMTAIKALTEKEPVEKGEYDDAKDLIRTGAEALAEHIIPAASDALAQWRSTKTVQPAMPMPAVQPPRPVVQARMAPQQQALPVPRPRSAHDAVPLPVRGPVNEAEIIAQAVPAQAAPVVPAPAPAPAPVAETVQPAVQPAVQENPDEVGNRIWISVINLLAEINKAGVPPADAVKIFQGWCIENKVPFEAVATKLSETDADEVLREIKPYVGNPLVPAAYQATLKAATEMLSTQEGAVWFDDVADALEIMTRPSA